MDGSEKEEEKKVESGAGPGMSSLTSGKNCCGLRSALGGWRQTGQRNTSTVQVGQVDSYTVKKNAALIGLTATPLQECLRFWIASEQNPPPLLWKKLRLKLYFFLIDG